MKDGEKLPGEYRLARRISEELETAKAPYVIPVVSNFLIRVLLAATVASFMASGYLIIFGSAPARESRNKATNNHDTLNEVKALLTGVNGGNSVYIVEHNQTQRLICYKFDADQQPRPADCAEAFSSTTTTP